MALDSEREVVARIPEPSSATRISRRPPPRVDNDLDARGPASSAFSTSSLTTLAGPFDDLTRGDAVDEIRRQLTYGHPVPQPARRRDTGG